jgi:hypothetical protein
MPEGSAHIEARRYDHFTVSIDEPVFPVNSNPGETLRKIICKVIMPFDLPLPRTVDELPRSTCYTRSYCRQAFVKIVHFRAVNFEFDHHLALTVNEAAEILCLNVGQAFAESAGQTEARRDDNFTGLVNVANA